MSEKNDNLIYNLLDDLISVLTYEVDGKKFFLTRNFASLSNFDKFYIAEMLIKKGYRKIENGIVVLSSERYSMFCELENTHIELTEEFRQEVRKEMAREIIYKLKESLVINNEENTEFFDYAFTLETINELAKQYGVEVGE